MRKAASAILLAAAALTGCAAPGPKMFPPGPVAVEIQPGGFVERLYDIDRDRKVDFRERVSPDGRVMLLRYDPGGDGEIDLEAAWGGGPAPGDRHLIILLDSVPFSMVRDLYGQGRFRHFHPPSRTISPFPVMTDLSFSEFFGMTPCRAIESEFYDGHELREGYFNYAAQSVAGWLSRIDYYLPFPVHAAAYFWSDTWYEHELGKIQRHFLRGSAPRFVGYVVGTSSLGARQGRSGHQTGLVRLDRTCQWIVHQMKGRVQITLLSDHGHNLERSRRIPLPDILRRLGYRVVSRLSRPEDVVVPQFGVVTCAAIHTKTPANVARDLAGVEGVAQTAYLDGADVVVLSRDGRARIRRSERGYRYLSEFGDPLQMHGVLEFLRTRRVLDSDGYAPDRAFFDATAEHRYPDAVARLWRAFHGLIEHTPDVLIAVEDGYHCGSALMSKLVDLSAAHGNLGQASSYGFVMTTCGGLPGVMRMAEVREELVRIGVPLDESVTNAAR